MREVVIELATQADVAAIHRLEAESFPHPWKREFFENELRASGRLSLVACRGTSLLGYLFAMWYFDELHVNKIAVAENERRHGIASALMHECLRFARRQRIQQILLEVRKSNSGAQDFYRHLGFDPSYVRQRYYPDGEAAVVMMRNL